MMSWLPPGTSGTASRSLVPIMTMSTPGRATISSIAASAAADSNCTITMIASFIAGSASVAGNVRYCRCASPGASPRSPSGGYFAAATTARASAAERTPGAITPSAPPSSTREMYSGVFAGTRTSAGTPASSAMIEIWLVACSDRLECSRSMYSVSKPALFAMRTISTPGTRRTVIDATTSPRASFSLTLLRAMSRACTRLLHLDSGRLDDGPPLLDLGLVQRAQRLRRLLRAREDVLAEAGEARAHLRIGQRGDDRRIELRGHVLRRRLRQPQRVPAREVELGQPRLVHRRNVGRRGEAGRGGEGGRPVPAPAQLP